MYTYEGYLKYQKQYIKGIKKISQHNSYPSVSVSKQTKGKLKTTSQTFNAFFNEKGKLIHLNNLHPRSNSKFSYYYDSQNRLVKIVQLDKISNALLRENNIKHQDKFNFVEYIREYIDKTYERIREIHHSKEYDTICVEQKNVPMDEWYLHQTLKFDDFIREEFNVYADKRSEISIFELSKNNKIIKSYSKMVEYNIHGDLIGNDISFLPKKYYLFAYYDNGLIKSEDYISDEPWTKTYEYKYNGKGHWLEKVTCIDNSLQFICERNLFYY